MRAVPSVLALSFPLLVLLLILLPAEEVVCQPSVFSDGLKVVIPSNLTVDGVDLLGTIASLQQQIALLQSQVSSLQPISPSVTWYRSGSGTYVVPVSSGRKPSYLRVRMV